MGYTQYLYEFVGEIITIGDVFVLERNERPSINKRTIGVKGYGQQVVYFEHRNTLNENIKIGSLVRVAFYFAGSQKGDKNYNNIIAHTIINQYAQQGTDNQNTEG